MKKTTPLTTIVVCLSFLLTASLSRAADPADDPVQRALDEAQSAVVGQEVEADVEVDAQERDASESQLPEDATGRFVKALDVQGNRSIGLATILSKIRTRVGQEYRQNVISDDLKRLYNTGYFSDVRLDRKDEDGGVRVIIAVDEKPIIDEITFSKIRYFGKKVLLSKLKTQTGKFLDRKVLHDDLNTIREMYHKKGLTQAEIDVETFVDDETNKATLHFVVDEGFRVRIRRINIFGNTAFKDGRIIKAMKSRNAWLLNSGFLKDDVVNEDMERVQAFYEKEGYIDAKVTYEIEQVRGGLMNLNVQVDEGQRYFIGDIALTGNLVLSVDEINAVMKDMKPGRIFSKIRLADDLANVKTLYFDRGYIFARVNESTSLDTNTGKVDLRLEIVEGNIAYINKVLIQGNTQTRYIVIRRELRMYPGEQFDGVKLRRSKERLNSLGYFEDVAFDIEDTDVPDQKDLVVDVKEAKTGAFSFGGGYSTVDQLIGFVEVEQKNFDFSNWPSFTGGGQTVSARAEFGSTRNNMILSFTEPWLFDYPVSAGFDIYRMQHEREADTGYAYNQVRTGGKLRLGKEISEYLSAAGYYRLENIEISDMESDVSADLKAEEGKNVVSSIGGSLTEDHRDNRLAPSKGWLASVSSDLAGGAMAGDKDFYRLETNGAYYVPFNFASVLEISGRMGMVRAYGDTSKVPIFERYFSGGARSIRGYDERSIGPLDANTKDPIGGESILVGSVEYTIPLIDVIKFATFFDIGNVWSKYSDFASNRLYAGYGIGLRIKTPIGPMNLDYGIPLDRQPDEDEKSKTGKFYFSVSRGF